MWSQLRWRRRSDIPSSSSRWRFREAGASFVSTRRKSSPAVFDRLRRLLVARDVRLERDEAHGHVLIESFIPGIEYAVEGLLTHGVLQTFAMFDKPDPLDGPFFEETIYRMPSLRRRRFRRASSTPCAQPAPPSACTMDRCTRSAGSSVATTPGVRARSRGAADRRPVFTRVRGLAKNVAARRGAAASRDRRGRLVVLPRSKRRRA